MDPNQRHALIAAMFDGIVVGTDKSTMQWANAATRPTGYANGALKNLRGEVVEPNPDQSAAVIAQVYVCRFSAQAERGTS